jgi:hypothetical protein
MITHVDPKTTQYERLCAHREKHSPQRWHGISRQCCVCKRVKVRGLWMYFPIPDNAPVSHGYCTSCMKKEMDKIKEVSRENL